MIFVWERGGAAQYRFWLVSGFGGNDYSRLWGSGPSFSFRAPIMIRSIGQSDVLCELLGAPLTRSGWFVFRFLCRWVFSTSTVLATILACVFVRLQCPVNPVYCSTLASVWSVAFHRFCLLLGKVSGFWVMDLVDCVTSPAPWNCSCLLGRTLMVVLWAWVWRVSRLISGVAWWPRLRASPPRKALGCLFAVFVLRPPPSLGKRDKNSP